jgi:hypothetical protein
MSSSLLGRRQSQKSSPVINVSFFSFIFEIAAVITAYFLKQCRASPTCISDLKATLGRRGGKKDKKQQQQQQKEGMSICNTLWVVYTRKTFGKRYGINAA